MAEHDINSNIKSNMIIQQLQREKKVHMTFRNTLSILQHTSVMYTANPIIMDLNLTVPTPVFKNTQILCADSKNPPVFLSLPVYKITQL